MLREDTVVSSVSVMRSGPIIPKSVAGFRDQSTCSIVLPFYLSGVVGISSVFPIFLDQPPQLVVFVRKNNGVVLILCFRMDKQTTVVVGVESLLIQSSII